MSEKVNLKVPILYYLEPEGNEELSGADLFPYIEVQQDEEFPKVLFVQEWRETGEFELTNEGKQSIVDRDIKMFINNDIISSILPEELYAKLREEAGLPLRKKKV